VLGFPFVATRAQTTGAQRSKAREPWRERRPDECQIRHERTGTLEL
jgi:hypothetical protein